MVFTRSSLVLLYLNLRTFYSGALLLRGHAAIVPNFIKEIALTGPVLYFSQSVLLMYGTNYLNLLTLVHYRCLCKMCISWIYLAICIYNSITFCLFVGQLSVHSALLSCLLANKDSNMSVFPVGSYCMCVQYNCFGFVI